MDIEMDIGRLCPRQISAWVVSGSDACDLISVPSPAASASTVRSVAAALDARCLHLSIRPSWPAVEQGRPVRGGMPGRRRIGSDAWCVLPRFDVAVGGVVLV